MGESGPAGEPSGDWVGGGGLPPKARILTGGLDGRVGRPGPGLYIVLMCVDMLLDRPPPVGCNVGGTGGTRALQQRLASAGDGCWQQRGRTSGSLRVSSGPVSGQPES